MKTGLLMAAALALTAGAGGQTRQQNSPLQMSGRSAPSERMPQPNLASSPWGLLGEAGIQLQIQSLIPAAKTTGSSGKTLGDAGTYKMQLSVRTESGGAEIHAHWDDVMVVEEGCAQLITGGTVVAGKTDADGETRGTKIEGGHSQILMPGDVAMVHAGTPHQILLAPGAVYGAVVLKIREP